ncbi:MAG: glutaminyl-peptide cyclotransferase [Microthrixaceae bacterium]|nr:glutaminyl-peptide cyclotransferase [Microthrixaceae bacterium]
MGDHHPGRRLLRHERRHQPGELPLAGRLRRSRDDGRRTCRRSGRRPQRARRWDGRYLWANRYLSNEILRIDLDCGVVDGVVDASELASSALARMQELRLERDLDNRDVLNGIAWVRDGSSSSPDQPSSSDRPSSSDQPSAGDRYYVTGKRWPVLFEVRFVKR